MPKEVSVEQNIKKLKLNKKNLEKQKKKCSSVATK